MPRIVDKACPDLEGILLSEGQDPQSELEAMLEGHRERECSIEEVTAGEYMVSEKNGQFIGIFLIDC